MVYHNIILLLYTQDWYDSGVSSPYHDCSIMEYLRKDTYNWELTVKLIERAKLTDMFGGNDPSYKEITCFAPPSYSILRYRWDNVVEKHHLPPCIRQEISKK